MLQYNPLSTEPFPDRSTTQIFRRRLLFVVRYLRAKANQRRIESLLQIVERSFAHPWVADVELKIRPWPGGDTRLERLWRAYKSLPIQSMHWDAPVAISVFRERRGKKRQALCMSVYLANNSIYIAQIQGIARTDAPKELRSWPKIFIESCRMFAAQEKLNQVMVPKAETLYSYRNPFLRGDLSPDARAHNIERIRRNMKLLYDTNAIQLGFIPNGDWFMWKV